MAGKTGFFQRGEQSCLYIVSLQLCSGATRDQLQAALDCCLHLCPPSSPPLASVPAKHCTVVDPTHTLRPSLFCSRSSVTAYTFPSKCASRQCGIRTHEYELMRLVPYASGLPTKVGDHNNCPSEKVIKAGHPSVI